MKIAITSLYLPSGSKIGVGYVVHSFANKLVDRGHSVTVFSQSGPSPDSKYDVIVVPSGDRLRTFGFAWNLRRYDFSAFDVLNAHGDDWFLFGRKRPRHIHTFHGSCLAEMIHASGIRTKSRMAALAVCEFLACALADELVAVSNNTKNYNPFVQKVIPNGVDLAAFAPAPRRSDAASIMFVGTMTGRKRGHLLLKAFRDEVLPQIPECELWAVCEEPVEGKGVKWFGRVSAQKLAELYGMAWVFCLPSSYEGFGVPYIEALASGATVIATPNPGACEVTEGGKYGLLSDERNLGKTIVRALKDESLRSRFSVAGIARAQEFCWDRVCAEYESVFCGGSVSGQQCVRV